MITRTRTISLVSMFAVVLSAGCGKGPMGAHTATPACKSGAFTEQVERAIPAMYAAAPVELHTPTSLRRLIEPGCIIPFRAQSEQEAEEIDATVTEIGKVIVRVIPRDSLVPGAFKVERPVPVGGGKLYIGRGGLQIEVKAKDGTIVFYLEIKGKHVTYRAPKQPVFDADIDLAGTGELALPFDALVASVDACHDDQRVGIDEGGDVIEAKRGGMDLWRTRSMNADRTIAIDTSTACSATDTRFAWRSSAGEITHSLVAVSARSAYVLSLEVAGTADTSVGE
ncbi:MAG: hypothetical protein ACHREM_11565 [Polyangiales bacterium]